MKTILLLGGFGFIGTNMIKFVDQNFRDEYRFVVFDKFPSHAHDIKFDSIVKTYAGDFSDDQFIEQIFAENKIDVVFHFLSSTVPATSSNARYDVESNLIPTLKLLGIMDKYNVKDVVYLSSGGAIYGDYASKVHNEEDAVYPKSSYGVVKLSIEKYLLSYSELYGFNTLILRLSNPFGQFHYNEKQGIVNIAIRKALKEEPLQIWGDGNGIKDYIYIEDVCDIVLKLIKNGVESEVYNIASGYPMSINNIFSEVKAEIPSFKCEHVGAMTVDVQSFELDISKLRRRLGGYQFTQFKDALLKTIEWQRLTSCNG